MKDYLQAGPFSPGSMGPRLRRQSVSWRTEARGAIITSDEHLVDAVRGAAGTHIVPDPSRRSDPPRRLL